MWYLTCVLPAILKLLVCMYIFYWQFQNFLIKTHVEYCIFKNTDKKAFKTLEFIEHFENAIKRHSFCEISDINVYI